MKRLNKSIIVFFIFGIIIISCDFRFTAPSNFNEPSNLIINWEGQYPSDISLAWEHLPAEGDTIIYKVFKRYFNTDHEHSDDYYELYETPILQAHDVVNPIDSLVSSYKIQAYNAFTEEKSTFSNAVAFFPSYSEPFNMRLEQIFQNTIKISWDCRAVGFDGFVLMREVTTNDTLESTKTFPLISPMQHSILDEVDLYKKIDYSLTAAVGVDEESSGSNTEPISTEILPRLFSPSELSILQIDNNRVKLDWIDNSEGERHFIIERKVGLSDWSNESYQILPPNTTTFTDSVSGEGKTYQYRVKAQLEPGEDSFYSEETTLQLFFDLVGNYETSGNTLDIDVSQWFAFIADEYGGMQIVDCRNPSYPYISVSSYDLIPDRSICIEVKNETAYVGSYSQDGQSGVVSIVDVANPEEAILYANFTTQDIPKDIDVDGDFAFIADGAAGLTIFYIATSHPQIYSSLLLSGDARKIEIYGSYAFIALGEGGFDIVDLSDLLNPKFLRTISNLDVVNDLQVFDDKLFVAAGSMGMLSYEIEDLLLKDISPIYSAYPTGGFAYVFDIDEQSNQIMIGDRFKGIISGVIGANSITYIGQLEYDQFPNEVRLYGSYAFVSDNFGVNIYRYKQ